MNPAKYLEDHSITLDTLKEFGATLTPEKLTIPVKDAQGKFLYNKYRIFKGDAKYVFDKGSHPALFGIDKAKDRSWVVLTEGEVDAMRLWQEDIPAVSSTGGVQKFDGKMAQQLTNKIVYICYDSDEAGRKGVQKTADTLRDHNVTAKIIELPQAYKDVSDFFTQQDETKTKFAQLMKEAPTSGKWWFDNQPKEHKVISFEDLANKEFPPSKWLMQDILLTEGFSFIFGSEGTGKSLILLSIAKSLANGTPWLDMFEVERPVKVLLIDKENPLSMLADRAEHLDAFSPNLFVPEQAHNFELVTESGSFSDFTYHLARFVQELNIEVIMVDSFTDVMIGDENQREPTQAFFDSFRKLFPHTLVVVLHHENKPTQGVARESKHRSRGSTNIGAQLGTQFRLEASPTNKKELTFEQTKARNSVHIPKFSITMEVAQIGGGTTGVTGFKYVGEVVPEEDKQQQAEATVVEIMRVATSLLKSELIERTSAHGVSEASAKRAITTLIEKRLIESQKDMKNKRRMMYVWIPNIKEQLEKDNL